MARTTICTSHSRKNRAELERGASQCQQWNPRGVRGIIRFSANTLELEAIRAAHEKLMTQCKEVNDKSIRWQCKAGEITSRMNIGSFQFSDNRQEGHDATKLTLPEKVP